MSATNFICVKTVNRNIVVLTVYTCLRLT